MPVLVLETQIAAPPERCFDLARDMRAHAESAADTGERVVECPPSGLVELGDEVEFEAVHFGIRQRLRARIVEYDRPRRFVDQMVKGAFKRLRHTHAFEAVEGGPRMTDTFDFASPLGPLGALVDALLLGRYMRGFLEERNRVLKRLAERR